MRVYELAPVDSDDDSQTIWIATNFDLPEFHTKEVYMVKLVDSYDENSPIEKHFMMHRVECHWCRSYTEIGGNKMRWLRLFGPIVAFVVFILIFCIAIYMANAQNYNEYGECISYSCAYDKMDREWEQKQQQEAYEDRIRDMEERHQRMEQDRQLDTFMRQQYQFDKESAEREGRFGNPYYDD